MLNPVHEFHDKLKILTSKSWNKLTFEGRILDIRVGYIIIELRVFERDSETAQQPQLIVTGVLLHYNLTERQINTRSEQNQRKIA